MKPRILLSAKYKRQFYIDAVDGCGGEAVAEYCPEPSTDYDGLILCGGSDVNPKYYGQTIDGSVNIDDERDAAETELARAFISAGKPIMGICRGHQLLNIVFGGTLHQDIPTADKHRAFDGVDSVHSVTAENESLLGRIYGGSFFVNSAHHQAIDKLGEGLRIIATSPDDGYIEAIVHTTLPIFGVQWHPERMCFSKQRNDTVDGRYLFEHFIKMCK